MIVSETKLGNKAWLKVSLPWNFTAHRASLTKPRKCLKKSLSQSFYWKQLTWNRTLLFWRCCLQAQIPKWQAEIQQANLAWFAGNFVEMPECHTPQPCLSSPNDQLLPFPAKLPHQVIVRFKMFPHLFSLRWREFPPFQSKDGRRKQEIQSVPFLEWDWRCLSLLLSLLGPS